MADDLERLDDRALWQVWEAFGDRLAWARALERGGDLALINRALSELPDVSALEALEANRLLIQTLTAQRWYAMQTAREAGASWSEIGEALAMTKQGAQDWYQRKISEREQIVPDFHDAERARAAL